MYIKLVATKLLIEFYLKVIYFRNNNGVSYKK